MAKALGTCHPPLLRLSNWKMPLPINPRFLLIMQIFISLFQQQLKSETLTLFHLFCSPLLNVRRPEGRPMGVNEIVLEEHHGISIMIGITIQMDWQQFDEREIGCRTVWKTQPPWGQFQMYSRHQPCQPASSSSTQWMITDEGWECRDKGSNVDIIYILLLYRGLLANGSANWVSLISGGGSWNSRTRMNDVRVDDLSIVLKREISFFIHPEDDMGFSRLRIY